MAQRDIVLAFLKDVVQFRPTDSLLPNQAEIILLTGVTDVEAINSAIKTLLDDRIIEYASESYSARQTNLLAHV